VSRWTGVAVQVVMFPAVNGLAPWALSLAATRHGWTGERPSFLNLAGLIPVAAGFYLFLLCAREHYLAAPAGCSKERRSGGQVRGRISRVSTDHTPAARNDKPIEQSLERIQYGVVTWSWNKYKQPAEWPPARTPLRAPGKASQPSSFRQTNGSLRWWRLPCANDHFAPRSSAPR
jgi:hypothetical protein